MVRVVRCVCVCTSVCVGVYVSVGREKVHYKYASKRTRSLRTYLDVFGDGRCRYFLRVCRTFRTKKVSPGTITPSKLKKGIRTALYISSDAKFQQKTALLLLTSLPPVRNKR